MSSTFPGGGPDFYGGGSNTGRSNIAAAQASSIGNNNHLMGGGGGGGGGRIGVPNNLINPNANPTTLNQHHNPALLRLQQQQLLQQQQQQQSIGRILNDSINPQIGGGHRRPDFIGKRSLADFQNLPSSHQQIPSSFLKQQQNQYSLLQQQQTPLSLLQQHLYWRSVKQRTSNNFINNNVNNSNTHLTTTYQNHAPSSVSSFDLHPSLSPQELTSFSSLSSSPGGASSTTTRYGVPVNPNLRPQTISLMNNSNSNCSSNSLLSASLINNSNNRGSLMGVQSQNLGGNNMVMMGGGYPNMGANRVSSASEDMKPVVSGITDDICDNNFGQSNDHSNKGGGGGGGGGHGHKMLDSTLQELEKQLLDDEEEGDEVSVITNSEWSETFQILMSPAQTPTPTTPVTPPQQLSQTQNTPATTTNSCNLNPSPASQNNNNNNANNASVMISPSPISSTSSSCSSSASPPTSTVSAKQLITDAASAISDGKLESAIEIITRLSASGNPKGTSEQRLVAYMCNALKSRACPNELSPPPVMELFSKEHMGSMYMLHDLSACYRFGLLAANLVILDTIGFAQQQENCSRVHIIDFDIGLGGHCGQYVKLLRTLAERCQSQSSGANNNSSSAAVGELKLTVVSTELSNTDSSSSAGEAAVRDNLLKMAEQVGVNLIINVVSQRISELTPESLGIEEGESVVVNFAFRLYRVPDESVSMENLRDELLRRVKGLKPRLVTLVEQEMNGNTAPFMTRVNECVSYYGALFDSLEADATRNNPERGRLEEALGRKMGNSIGCEGRDRVERCEVFGKWRARMGMAGFELKALSQNVVESMKNKINAPRVGGPRIMVKEENGGVCFGWMGRALTVASAWR